jgi:hypothetical protein
VSSVLVDAELLWEQSCRWSSSMSTFDRMRRLAMVAAVGIAVLGLTAPAMADITLIVTDTNSVSGLVATSTVVVPGNPPLNASFTPGSFGNFSGFAVSVSTIPATGLTGALLTDVQVTGQDTGSAAGSVDTIVVTATGGNFTAPGPPSMVESTLTSSLLSGINGSTPAATASFTSSLIDNSGTFVNGTTAALMITGNGELEQEGMTSGGATSASIVANWATSYQLTNTLTTSFSLGQTGTLDATTQALGVPEPSTMGLTLCGGLLMLAGAWTRKSRND